MIPESCEEQTQGQRGARGGGQGRKEEVRGKGETQDGNRMETGPRRTGEGSAGKASGRNFTENLRVGARSIPRDPT